jgi:predicted nuclease of predicted toxin-antitoxin system
MINYNVDKKGILKVYLDNKILFEVSECANCSNKDIEMIIEEELNSMGYIWEQDNTITKKEE